MAESFPSVPAVLSFTLGGIDVATRLDFPNNARRVRVQFLTNAGKVATEGTDGAAIDANFYPVAADTEWSLFVDQDPQTGGRGPKSVFLASGVASTVVRCVCEAG